MQTRPRNTNTRPVRHHVRQSPLTLILTLRSVWNMKCLFLLLFFITSQNILRLTDWEGSLIMKMFTKSTGGWREEGGGREYHWSYPAVNWDNHNGPGREGERERERGPNTAHCVSPPPRSSYLLPTVESWDNTQTRTHYTPQLSHTEHRQDKLLPCPNLNNTSGNVETNYRGPVRGSVPV